MSPLEAIGPPRARTDTVLPSAVLACDLGHSKLALGLVDPGLRIRSLRRFDISGLAYPNVIATLLDGIARMVTEDPSIGAIGVSIAGQVDTESGVVSSRAMEEGEPNVGEWHLHTFSLAAMITERVNRPASLVNDGDAATVAEWQFGSGAGAANLVGLVLGTYVGSGVVLRSKLVQRRFSGPLLGAFVAPSSNGGYEIVGRGCSGVGIQDRARQVAARDPNGPIGAAFHSGRTDAAKIAELARAGDTDARRIFSEAGRYLGCVIASAINIFDPEVVVVGGGLLGAQDLLWPFADEPLQEHCFPSVGAPARIRRATYGPEAGLIGAALITCIR